MPIKRPANKSLKELGPGHRGRRRTVNCPIPQEERERVEEKFTKGEKNGKRTEAERAKGGSRYSFTIRTRGAGGHKTFCWDRWYGPKNYHQLKEKKSKSYFSIASKND